MKNFKFILSSLFVASVLLITMPSYAAQTGLAGCKAIFGSIEPAGGGGVVNNAGSIRATSSGPNIVICDLAGYRSMDSVFVRVNDANLDSLCNISTYSITGSLGASYTQNARRIFSFTQIALTNVMDNVNIAPYSFQLSCRLGLGDILHSYNVVNGVFR